MVMVQNIIIIGDVRAPITKEFVEAQLHQLSTRKKWSRFNATQPDRVNWKYSPTSSQHHFYLSNRRTMRVQFDLWHGVPA